MLVYENVRKEVREVVGYRVARVYIKLQFSTTLLYLHMYIFVQKGKYFYGHISFMLPLYMCDKNMIQYGNYAALIAASADWADDSPFWTD